ncbi:MAG TPA: GerW family sporulation protein [Limnochordales bacterium]
MEPSAQQDGQAPGAAGHPIDALMRTAMESIKAMVDVNTILGVPVEAPDGTVIIPVSRVSFGFVAGGSEFEAGERQGAFPFGGGSGAGVSLHPVAFLVVGQGQVRLLPVSERALYDRLLDLAPRVVEQLQRWVGLDGQGAARREGDVREREPAPESGRADQGRRQEAGPAAARAGEPGDGEGRRQAGSGEAGRGRLTLPFE